MRKSDTHALANQLELHYFFSDGSHSLDAFTRNKCESEFLLIIKEVLKAFELEIQIETVALQEGGLIELWQFLGANGAQISIIISIITPLLTLRPSSNSELDALNKQNLELSIEKYKLEIKKLQDEQAFDKIDIPAITQTFNADLKVVKHRSNFFETLLKSEKITHIETTLLYDNQTIRKVSSVEKNEFHNYVVSDSNLPIETIENAQLEIISPVLKQQGNYKWRGIYKGETIDFYMTDKEFKQSVFNREILFQNGFSIICVLEIYRSLNELGDLHIRKYTVPTVISTFEEGIQSDTQQGKKYLAQKKKDASPTLFD